ncbi:hypothetical protein SEA_Phreeze_47 [Mycobacterium phage Phreeze]|nr:hypothetical protein SEA_Phreeze_47 [Mycobacterium phage Phreeze]QLF83933.1 hypothetical protein SEA_BECKERTON_48 [Mycobacterium phage Beckerton]
MSVTVVTGHRWYDLYSYSELPAKAREEFASEYEMVTNGEDMNQPMYFKYRRTWFSLEQFARISTNAIGFEHSVSEDSPLANWSGICHGTYDSGWVVRLPQSPEEFDDHDGQVQVGRFY